LGDEAGIEDAGGVAVGAGAEVVFVQEIVNRHEDFPFIEVAGQPEV
jgi:hypothetical protein